MIVSSSRFWAPVTRCDMKKKRGILFHKTEEKQSSCRQQTNRQFVFTFYLLRMQFSAVIFCCYWFSSIYTPLKTEVTLCWLLQVALNLDFFFWYVSQWLHFIIAKESFVSLPPPTIIIVLIIIFDWLCVSDTLLEICVNRT